MEWKDQLYLFGMGGLMILSKYLGLNGELFAALTLLAGVGAGVTLLAPRSTS